jgi:hypothetical protein
VPARPLAAPVEIAELGVADGEGKLRELLLDNSVVDQKYALETTGSEDDARSM